MYSIRSQPDTINRSTKEIDYILEANDQPLIAVEHSMTESYESQTKHEQETYRFLNQINEKVRGQIPGDRYFTVNLPDNLISQLSHRQRRSFVNELSDWIIKTAPNLTRSNKRSLTAKYMDGRVHLQCKWNFPKLNGTLTLSLWIPEKLRKRRVIRIRRLLKTKLLKLLKYRFNRYCTALAIEDNDISISDSLSVEETIRKMCRISLIEKVAGKAYSKESHGAKVADSNQITSDGGLSSFSAS